MTRLAPNDPSRVIAPRGEIVRLTWRQQIPPPHEFSAALCPEEEGGYSVFALNYPGVISQGETVDEAKTNIAEAFLAMLESRRNHGEAMAFSHRPVDVPKDCERTWISVHG